MTDNIHAHDRVRFDGSDKEYEVKVVGLARRDVYVSEDPNAGGGTWVAIDSVTHVNGKSVR